MVAQRDNIAALDDGRRRRREQSREAIIDAMLEMINEGHVEPRAEQVAERAGLNIRTVFRHFNDMESLYREIMQRVHARIHALLDRGIAPGGWPEQLEEVVARRAGIYEQLFVVRLTMEAVRHRSTVMSRDIAAATARTRRRLRALLPANLLADNVVFESLDATLSFEFWIRLRREQKLAPGQARQVMYKTAAAILARAENPGA